MTLNPRKRPPGKTHRLHTWCLSQPIQQLLPIDESLWTRFAQLSRFHPRDDQLTSVETQVRAHEPGEAGQEQSAEKQHDETEGDLCGHERLKDTEAGGVLPTSRFERIVWCDSRSAERRRKPENQRDRAANAAEKDEHPPVQGHIQPDRRVRRREELHDLSPSHQPHERSERGGDKRQHRAFNQYLLHQPPPSRSNRDAESEFAIACRRARQQQAGHIRGGDQENEGGHGTKDPKRATERLTHR